MAHASGMISSNRSNRRLQKHRSVIYANKKEQMNFTTYGDFTYTGRPIEVKKTTINKRFVRRETRTSIAIVLTLLMGLFIVGFIHYFYTPLF